MTLRFILGKVGVVCFVFAATSSWGANSPWAILAQYFTPPVEHGGQLGPYRSPLIFQDGSRVKTAEDWARRREEIRAEWVALMGPWPALIPHPKVEQLAESEREGLSQRRVRVEIAPGQTGEGWLLRPRGAGPFPAVLVVYYEPETSVGLNPKQPFRDYAWQLAKRGFVTLAIGTPGGDARKPALGGARCQPLSFHAYVAANCWQALADLPEVDAARIGVVGHSYGGKWALFAGALWEKFAAVAVSDPGIMFDETRSSINYWEPWYLGWDAARTRTPGLVTPENPRTGAYAEMIRRGRDLHEIHALLAPRPFLVSGGAEDPVSRWTALNHLDGVNRILGFQHQVGMTNRPDHSPDEAANEKVYAFFEHFLQSPRR